MHPEPNPVFILLAIFVPMGTVVVLLGLAGLVAYTRQRIRQMELAADLVQQMLSRKLSVEEIERILLAWSQDPKLAKTLTRARKQLATM